MMACGCCLCVLYSTNTDSTTIERSNYLNILDMIFYLLLLLFLSLLIRSFDSILETFHHEDVFLLPRLMVISPNQLLAVNPTNYNDSNGNSIESIQVILKVIDYISYPVFTAKDVDDVFWSWRICIRYFGIKLNESFESTSASGWLFNGNKLNMTIEIDEMVNKMSFFQCDPIQIRHYYVNESLEFIHKLPKDGTQPLSLFMEYSNILEGETNISTGYVIATCLQDLVSNSFSPSIDNLVETFLPKEKFQIVHDLQNFPDQNLIYENSKKLEYLSHEGVGITNNSHLNKARRILSFKYPQLSNISSVQISITVAFYLKELTYHGANNRLLNLICNFEEFKRSNQVGQWKFVVITGAKSDVGLTWDEDFYHNLVNTCGIKVVAVESLAPGGVYDNKVNTTSDILDLRLLLDGYVDFLVMTNTNGDSRSEALLIASEMCDLPPIVIVDLSNPSLPIHWARYVDALITLSRSVAFNPITLSVGTPIAVIYPGLNEAWLQNSLCFQNRYGEKKEGFAERRDGILNFAFIGRVESDRSLGLLLKAIDYLIHTNPEESLVESAFPGLIHDFSSRFRLTIVGSGYLQPALEIWVANRNLSSYVTFVGHKNSTEIQKLLETTVATINPILAGETYGFANMESQSMGVPVVCFDRGAAPETIFVGARIKVFSNVNPVYSLANGIAALFDGVRKGSFTRKLTCEAFLSHRNMFSKDSAITGFIDFLKYLLAFPLL